MCVAVPGKILEINGDYAVIDVMGNRTNANVALVDAKVGEYALLHAGCVIEIIQKDKAEELTSLLKELKDAF